MTDDEHRPEPDLWRAKEKFDTGDYESSFEIIYSPEKPESEHLNGKGDVIYKDVEPLYVPESIQRMKDRFVEEIEKRPNIQLTHAVLEELLEEAFIGVKEKAGSEGDSSE